MGAIVDTAVFAAFERSGRPIDLLPWAPLEDVFINRWQPPAYVEHWLSDHPAVR
jgi:hypothetical protein